MTTAQIAAPPEVAAPAWRIALLISFFLLNAAIGAALQHSARISLRAFAGARKAVACAWAHWLRIGRAASIGSLLPRALPEAALPLSAGFAEELVFRGCLQRRLTALPGHD